MTAVTGTTAAATPRRGRRPPPARTVRRPGALGLLAVCAALLAVLAGAAPAAAHAVLTDSTPAADEVLPRAPRQVRLGFSEEVHLPEDGLRVLDPRGRRVDEGSPRRMGATAGRHDYAVALRDGLRHGTYTVAWRAVSADSHPIAGAFTFAIGSPSSTRVALAEPEVGGGTVGTLYHLARFTAYAGLLVLVGGAGFVLYCRPHHPRPSGDGPAGADPPGDGPAGGAPPSPDTPREAAGGRAVPPRPLHRLLLTGWVALAAATLVMLALRHPYTTSGGLSDALDVAGLAAVVRTAPGEALLCRLLLLGGAALWLAALFGHTLGGGRPGGSPRWLAPTGVLLAVGFAATWALTEHAATGVQPWLAVPVDVLHLLAAAGWLGGLAALLVTLRLSPPVPRAAVRRFSGAAFGCVVVLAVTGGYQSWRQVGLSWSAWTSTDFGRLLLLKGALVVVVLLVAARSRRWTARLAELTPTAVPAVAPSARAAPGPAPSRPADEDAVTGKNGKTGKDGKDGKDGVAGGVDDGVDDGGDDGVDSVRAAQLARQRQAVEAARRRRERDADPMRRRLRHSVLAETAVAVVVLAVTTLLTTTEPARTAQLAERAAARHGAPPAAREPGEPLRARLPFDTGGPGGRGTALLTLDPGRTGGNTLHLRTRTPSGAPLAAEEVRVSLTLVERALGPLPAELERVAEGHWRAARVQLPMAGTWRVTLTVRTSDIDQVTESTTVTIR